MIAYISTLGFSMSLTQGWAMLYRQDFDNDGVMHPEILIEVEI